MPESGVSVLENDDCVVVRFEGRARVETAVHLKQRLSQAVARDVAIDWAEAEHVDACVLQVMLALRKLLLERGRSFGVRRDNAKVRDYLKMSGLADYFPVRNQLSDPSPVEGANA
jgi:anti-anti-sigma factor